MGLHTTVPISWVLLLWRRNQLEARVVTVAMSKGFVTAASNTVAAEFIQPDRI